MLRRDFIVGLGSATAWPLTARAQQPERMRKVALLTGFAEGDPIGQAVVAAFQQRLQGLGWTEGRNVRFEVRWAAAGDLDLMRTHAVDLVRTGPDLILVHGNRALAAVQRETHDIPIVFAAVADPVDYRQVESLARPGGNATGFTIFVGPMLGKLTQILKEIAPDVTHVALLHSPDTPSSVRNTLALEAATEVLGVKLVFAPVRNPVEIEQSIDMFAREPNGGLVVIPDLTMTTFRRPIIALASRYRLPAIYGLRQFVAEGGLISYGNDLRGNYRSGAVYVDRILRGEKPSDLPVQQSVKIELVINTKTAKAFGIEVPEALLAIADEVIE
jgi:putative tryptophan/tyrosine transport system substrate-binding protein